MSLLLAAAGGWAVGLWISRRRKAAALPVGIVVALLLWQPALGLMSMVAGTALWGRARLAARRRAARRASGDLALLGELVLVGLTAGLGLSAALELAAGEVAAPLSAELRAVLRRSKRCGLAAALAGADGYGRRLYLLLARAAQSGAATADAVAAFVHEQRDAERSRRLEEARRLPVRLMVPLALLILPGFVILTVGPTMVASVRRIADQTAAGSSLPSAVGRPPT